MDNKIEEKTRYWKSRMQDRLLSLMGQADIEFNDIQDHAKHINLKDDEIKKAIGDVYAALGKLRENIIEAKRKEE
jgi:hypothetical protein